MPDVENTIKELEEYIAFMSGGATGRLLKDCHTIIVRQEKELSSKSVQPWERGLIKR